MTTTSIPRRKASDSPEDLAAALDEAGCLVVEGMSDAEARQRVRSQVEPHMPEHEGFTSLDDPDAFYPGKTRRATALVARSEQVRDFVMNPVTASLYEHHLGSNHEGVQLHVTAATEVGPGARTQILHREEDSFGFFPLPRPNLILASIWAVTDFTAENGGTLLVPGSHRWDETRKPEPDEIVSAEMPAGSVLYWLGGTLHGAGANISDDWRYGVILTYSLGWLRQEGNQSLDIPTEVANTLSPELQALIGRTMQGSLGFFDPRMQA